MNEEIERLAQRVARLEAQAQEAEQCISDLAARNLALTQACRALLVTHHRPYQVEAFLQRGLEQAIASELAESQSDHRVQSVQEHADTLLRALETGKEAWEEEQAALRRG